MIKAQKHSLEWQLAQGKVAALTRELDFLIDVFYQIINMATFVAGFGSLGIGVDMLDIYEEYAQDGESEWRKWLGRGCTYLSAVTLFLSLWVVCVVLSVVPNARRWALEGPVESVEDSVRKLKNKLTQVINVFTTSLFTFIVERVGNCALFDITTPVTPAMFVTGVITLILIGLEYRSAMAMYTGNAGTTYAHRAFPERPPELYRELGRMRRMSAMLGTRSFGPSYSLSDMQAHMSSLGCLPQRCASRSADANQEVGSAIGPPGARPSHHSWVDVTRVTTGKERGSTRRYVSLEDGVVTLYHTYEDYILDMPSESLRLPLAEYKLAELVDEDAGEFPHFELVPVASALGSHSRTAVRHTYHFQPDTAKACVKWVNALRAALLSLDDDGPEAHSFGTGPQRAGVDAPQSSPHPTLKTMMSHTANGPEML